MNLKDRRAESQNEFDQSLYTEELSMIIEEYKQLDDEMKRKKQLYKETKEKFDREKKKPENSKVMGQPLHPNIDSIHCNEFGCNCGATQGRDFQGGAIQTVMGKEKVLF